MQFFSFQIHRLRANGLEYAGFYLDRPAGSGDYLYLQFKSNGAVRIFDTVYSVHNGDCLILSPHTPSTLQATEPEFCHDWVHFTVPPAEADAFATCGLPFDRVFHPQDSALLSRIVRAMHEEFVNAGIGYEVLLLCGLQELLIRILRDLTDSRTLSHHMLRVRSAFSALRSELYTGKYLQEDVPDLAERLCFSRSRFTELYRMFFGVSPKADLSRARFARAKELLTDTDLKLSEVAALCGYSSEYHLLYQFRALAGMTPGAYRERNAHPNT